MDREENGISHNKTAALTKADHTFDGLYFENIEKIGDFPPIINLKNANQRENEEYKTKCKSILENQHPQLYEFMLKHEESFENFFKLNNNGLLTLT